jgi:glutathione S-transferase
MTKLHYFQGRGRAETTRWMLALNQITFENIPIETPEALTALRESGRLPFDQLPLLEIEGQRLSQSGALIRYLARYGGYYGDTDKDALWCDIIAGAIADFAETGLQAAFQPTETEARRALQTRFAKFGPKFEAQLAQNNSGFCVGKYLTFADVILVEALSGYLEWVPDILDNSPLLNILNEKIINIPSIASYLDSAQRYPMPGNAYVIDVAYVLRRALPSHFPDTNRFVLNQ